MMSMSLIAMLLSLAMMLTGAGGEGMPAQSARTMVLRNVTFTYNGETVRLAPEAHVGASTDGENAVFDFGVDVNGKTLLPIQLGVGEKGVTALFEESGVAVNVTAEALENIMAQAGQMVQMVQAENPELMAFITEEYLPAYTGMLKLVSDREFQVSMREKSNGLFDSIVDRGEGTSGVIVIDDVNYDVLSYNYTIDARQMGALADAAYDLAPELAAFRDATLKLYDMMPEETGLKGITSISDVMDRFGIQMQMVVDEQRSEDGAVDVMDAVLTLDLSGTIEAMMANGLLTEQAEPVPYAPETAEAAGEAAPEAAEEAEAAESEPMPETAAAPAALPPLMLNIHSVTVDDYIESNVNFSYDVEDSAVDCSISASQDTTTMNMEMNMDFSQNDEKIGRMSVSGVESANADGGSGYGVNYSLVVRDTVQLDLSAYGDVAEDGTSDNTVNLDGRTPDASFALSFDLDVTGDAIEDLANAAEPEMVIDDLSEAGLKALTEDQGFAALMMKVGGSLGMDANKLMSDASIKNAIALLGGERLPITVDDDAQDEFDYSYEVDGDSDGDFVVDVLDDGEGDYEPVEDDGELGFEAPELTFLPEGWSVNNVETDTAYDWVGISVTDESGAEALYATFFKDMDGEISNYVVSDNGGVQEGRAMSVSDYGEGGLSVTLRENSLYGNLSFVSNAIDVETLGKVVAGIKF